VRLVVEQGALAGREFPLERSMVSIGRGADNNLVLPVQGVSRFHARLERGRGGWLLTDVGSTNGTQVNGQPLAEQQSHLLYPGDRITMGSAVLLVVADEMPIEDEESVQGSRRLHPALMVVGALGVIVVLVGMIFLLVMVLQPDEPTPPPTAAAPIEQIVTALPLPSGVDRVVTAVATWIPTGLPLPFFGSTPTPTPAP
jgi:pSer/pThr/pTyr-binding forkhead associated (FHA) protein